MARQRDLHRLGLRFNMGKCFLFFFHLLVFLLPLPLPPHPQLIMGKENGNFFI